MGLGSACWGWFGGVQFGEFVDLGAELFLDVADAGILSFRTG